MLFEQYPLVNEAGVIIMLTYQATDETTNEYEQITYHLDFHTYTAEGIQEVLNSILYMLDLRIERNQGNLAILNFMKEQVALVDVADLQNQVNTMVTGG